MYLIKKTYTATANNPNFKGQTLTWYCGTKGSSSQILDWFIKEYAYKTKAALANGLKAAKELVELEEGWGNWNIALDVLEV